MTPDVRISVMYTDTDNYTLRCYAEGYHPVKSVIVSWYNNGDTHTPIRNCQRGLFSDGTYRQFCDYICNKRHVCKAVCEVRHLLLNVSTTEYVEREASSVPKNGTSNVFIFVITFTAACAIVALLLYRMYGKSLTTSFRLRHRTT